MITTDRSPTRTDDSGRARMPDDSGYATGTDGARLAYDVYGSGDPTLVFLPSAPIVHSRQWKGQVPYFSRRHRVITYDGRGNGLSDRPTTSAAYHDDLMTSDIAAVMDATGTERAVLIGLCVDGVWRAIRLAAQDPGRVLGIVAFGVGVPVSRPRRTTTRRPGRPSTTSSPPTRGGACTTGISGVTTTPTSRASSSPRSRRSPIRPRRSTMPRAGPSTARSRRCLPSLVPSSRWIEGVEQVCRAVRCPMLLVHGTEDTCQRTERAQRLAELTGAPLVVVDGADHMIPGRHPVLANLLIRDFIRSLPEASNDGR